MTATVDRPSAPEVVTSSREDTRRAVRNALTHVGLTYEQLQSQARSGEFASHAARMAWVAVRDLERFAV